MKRLMLLFFVLLLSTETFSQNFWVPDSTFRHYLKVKFPGCFTANDSLNTACSSIQSLTYLNIRLQNLTDIRGIEHFVSLKSLYADQNAIANVYQLPSTLLNLDLSNNQLSTCPQLPDSLRTLLLNFNFLDSLKPLPVRLEKLQCFRNTLTKLPVLPLSLKELDVTGNVLTILPSLPSNLLYLSVSYNLFDSLPPLPSSLLSLNCSTNRIVNLPQLPPQLSFLNCSVNRIAQLPALPDTLQFLNCNINKLVGLPALPHNLTSLYCDSNQITQLPTLPPILYDLSCVNNVIASLPQLNQGLGRLTCSKNHLSYLPSLANIHFLDCSSNFLNALPALPSNLYFLYCSNNPIYCLPILPSSLAYLLYNATFITCIPNATNFSWIQPSPLPVCSTNTRACNYLYTSGYVFSDTNGNGNKDVGEKGIEKQVVYNGNFCVNSDTSGFFSAVCDTGNRVFSVSVPLYHTATTPSVQNNTLSGNFIDTLYFGLQPIPGINDLRINLQLISFLRPGFKAAYLIHYTNIGTTTILSPQIKFLNPNQLNKLSCNPVASNTNGDTLIWNLPSIPSGFTDQIVVLDSISVTTALGTQMVAQAWISPIAGDYSPLDNSSIDITTVRGSSDPNDKSVKPEFIEPNYSDFLSYTIRFQNTGTDTAFSVLIVDSLSASFDASSIELIETSHPAKFWMDNGIAHWFFGTILLPDSNTNEAASHGYVSFKIKSTQNTPVGTQLSNKADIYFDYNSPVTTNTAYVNVTPLSIKSIIKNNVLIFPNPVFHSVQIKNGNTAIGVVELMDENGRKIETKYISSSSYEWRLEHLQKGIYFLKGANWCEKIMKK